MKVSELIEKLEQIDGDTDVLLSLDQEGNAYNHLSTLEEMEYHQEGREIDIGFSELTHDLIKRGYSEDDLLGTCERCVILWP